MPSNIASRSYLLPRLDLEEGHFNILSGTGGSQPTSALFLMISLYNLYDIENRFFTCRNKYSINKVNETGPVESLLKLLGSENDISVRAEADGALRALFFQIRQRKEIFGGCRWLSCFHQYNYSSFKGVFSME